jgi:hypothetical protein
MPVLRVLLMLALLASLTPSMRGQQPAPTTGLPGDILGAETADTAAVTDLNPVLDLSDARVEYALYGSGFSWISPDSGVARMQDYDPAFRGLLDRQSLGNLGQASQPLWFGSSEALGTVGLDLAGSPWYPYLRQPDSMRWYRVNKPYTKLRYVLGSGVQQQLGLLHTQNLMPNLNVALDYTRHVSVGQSAQQKAGVHDLALSAWFRSPNRRYAVHAAYVFGGVLAEENGGAAIDSPFAFTPREAAPIRLPDALHEHKSQRLHWRQSFRLGRRAAEPSRLSQGRGEAGGPEPAPTGIDGLIDTLVRSAALDTLAVALEAVAAADSLSSAVLDSLASGMPRDSGAPARASAWEFWHELVWSTDRRRFTDARPDTAFYPSFLFPVADTLQVAYSLARVENTLGLGNTARIDSLPLSMPFQVGLTHRVDRLQATVGLRTQNDLIAWGRWSWQPPADSLQRWRPRAHAEGRLNLRGELHTAVHAGFSSPQRSLLLGLQSWRLEPSEQQQFFFSAPYFWDRELGAETRLVPSLSYRDQRLGTALSLRYHRVQNLIYWSTESLPQRDQGGTDVLQLLWQQNFRLGNWHLDNTVALQQSSSDRVNLPQYWGRHSLYYEGNFFEDALFARFGADVRVMSPYTADAWNPLLAVFYLQEQVELEWYPVVDLYFAARIDRARIFLKGINLTQGLFSPGWYQTPGYPMLNRGLVLGIDWQFWY